MLIFVVKGMTSQDSSVVDYECHLDGISSFIQQVVAEKHQVRGQARGDGLQMFLAAITIHLSNYFGQMYASAQWLNAPACSQSL